LVGWLAGGSPGLFGWAAGQDAGLPGWLDCRPCVLDGLHSFGHAACRAMQVSLPQKSQSPFLARKRHGFVARRTARPTRVIWSLRCRKLR